MTAKNIIYRVENDDGPPISVIHYGLDATGLTITARFTKPDGELYQIVGAIDVAGDGADIPAEYHFNFPAGALTPAGDHSFDVYLSGTSIDNYSYPSTHKIVMRVRDHG